MKKAILFTMAAIAVSCTDASQAHRVLSQEGYTDITITGYDWLGCSEDDAVHDGFTAKGPSGKPAEGVVCCGLWAKGCTVRLY